MKKLALLLMLLPVSTFAQQQPATTMAVQISNAINNMALELDQDRQTIQALQKQLASANDKIKELEKKDEPKKTSP